MRLLLLAAWTTLALAQGVSAGQAEPGLDSSERVRVIRVPAGGLQPRVEVDVEGRLHLVALSGDLQASDVIYARSGDAGVSLGEPLAVSSPDTRAIAQGSVRGASLALGRDGLVHVAWNGAPPRGAGRRGHHEAPFFYTRLAADGRSFESPRDVIRRRHGLDGGGAVTADERGNVWVVWHAPGERGAGESGRRIWIARSEDDGAEFTEEFPAQASGLGVCPCCGIAARAADGVLAILSRTAHGSVHRDVELSIGDASAAALTSRILDRWDAPS